MRIKIIFLSLTLLMICLNSDLALSKSPKTTRYFFCGKFYDTWTTFGKVRGYAERPIIRWRDDEWDSDDGANPKERCLKVSKSFQDYYNRGLFNYVIPSRDRKGRGIVCVAQYKTGRCTGILWYVRPTDNPDEIIKQLFGALTRYKDPVNQSGGVYVDIEEAVPAE